MFINHQETVERATAHFRSQPDVEALLLGGSLAHGFAAESSDVDVMVLVSDQDYRRRSDAGQVCLYNADLSTYPGGYVDGKYISRAYLDQVEQRGSDPARFAFADAQVLYSRVDGLADQIRRIATFPSGDKTERIIRFHAQIQAWLWYSGEAAKRSDSYLMGVAASRVLLFGGRMILAHNEMLYPYHKWFFKVLERAPLKPDGLLDAMRRLSERPSADGCREMYDLIAAFRDWETDATPWPNRFLADSELTWLRDATAIDDI